MATDPQEEKLRAETRLVEAQITKLQQEISPAKPHQSLGTRLMDFFKVTGALVIGFGGVATAVTGYQLTEAKKVLLDAQITKTEHLIAERTKQLAALEQQQKKNAESVQKTLNATEDLVAKAQPGVPPIDTDKTLKKIETLRAELKETETSRLSKQIEFQEAIQRIEAPLR